MALDLRLLAAIIGGKTTACASRRLHRGGGMTVPGNVALALDPRTLAKLGRSLDQGCLLVTGTNGKTTTTGMIATVLQGAGLSVVSNHSGANIVFGLCAAAVADARLSGRLRSTVGVFEVDELWLERAIDELRPRLVVVLNFFRDQLDRSGELETAARRVGDGLLQLPPGAVVVANADDPQVVEQCLRLGDAPGGAPPPVTVVPFGIDGGDLALDHLPHVADARSCPRCGAALDFTRVVLAHCGTYVCRRCGFARPHPAHAAVRLEADGITSLSITIDDGTRLDTEVGGVYNAYNVVAAYAACRSLGIPPATIAAALARFRPKFGRQETLSLHGRAMRFMLAKNPAGFDEVLRTADVLGHARTYLIAINDGVADGRDVSWLWDVDFERLARSPQRPLVVAAGRRVEDLAVRLKYAGLPLDRVHRERSPRAALRRVAELTPAGEEAVVIPTYTAMLELRAVAEAEGAAAAFWVEPSTASGQAARAADGLMEDERTVAASPTQRR